MFELHIFEMKKLKTPFRKNGILTNGLSPYFLASLRHSYATESNKTTQTITNPRQLLSSKIPLFEKWNNIPQRNIQNQFNSMRRRLQAVIDARGGNTKY